MGTLRRWLGLDIAEPTVDPDTFDLPEELVGGADIDPAVFGLTAYSTSTVSRATRVDRTLAMQVPAVKRCRDLIAGTLGGLPLNLYGPDRQPADVTKSSLFEQPEKSVPRSVTMTRLFEDLLFEKVAWWDVVETRWGDYPTFVKRLHPRRVRVDEEAGTVYVDGKLRRNAAETLIRFDSPTDGLLIAGARAIRTAALLDVSAANAADGTPPIAYFTERQGTEQLDGELEDEDGYTEVSRMIADFQALNKARAIGYIPNDLVLEEGGWDPKKLQLAEQRQHAVLEIARVAGVDPEELGVSTTSRTYANMFERRKAFVDFTLAQYMIAVEDRLRMGDVTERGYYARFNLDSFLRSDPLSRYTAYAAGKAVGALDDDDIARLEDKPAPTAVTRPATVTALPSRQENAS